MCEGPSIELEIKLTYLEQTLQELNDVVFRQQRAIDALERRIATLSEQLHEQNEAASGNDALPIEKPPHY